MALLENLELIRIFRELNQNLNQRDKYTFVLFKKGTLNGLRFTHFFFLALLIKVTWKTTS